MALIEIIGNILSRYYLTFLLNSSKCDFGLLPLGCTCAQVLLTVPLRCVGAVSDGS